MVLYLANEFGIFFLSNRVCSKCYWKLYENEDEAINKFKQVHCRCIETKKEYSEVIEHFIKKKNLLKSISENINEKETSKFYKYIYFPQKILSVEYYRNMGLTSVQFDEQCRFIKTKLLASVKKLEKPNQKLTHLSVALEELNNEEVIIELNDPEVLIRKSMICLNALLCNYGNISKVLDYLNIHFKTFKRYYKISLVLSSSFYASHYQTDSFWTEEQLKKETLDELSEIIEFSVGFCCLFLLKIFVVIYTCRDLEDYNVLLVDGTDIEICKCTNNTIQSLSWSGKTYKNCVRFLMAGTSTSLPMFAIPPEGFYCTGRHNDQRTFDWCILKNFKNINTIAPPSLFHFFFYLFHISYLNKKKK